MCYSSKQKAFWPKRNFVANVKLKTIWTLYTFGTPRLYCGTYIIYYMLQNVGSSFTKNDSKYINFYYTACN